MILHAVLHVCLRCAALTGWWLSLLWVVRAVLAPAPVWGQGASEATVYIDRAIVAYDQKNYVEALRELQEALKVEPQNVEALYYQGVVYLVLNRPADAQASLEKALSLRPANADISFQLGVLYFNQENYEKAEPLLRQVYRVEPNRPNLGYYLGFIEYRNKNYRESLRFLDANVPSDNSFAQLTQFYRGLAMTSLGFPREGQVAIQQALKLQPVSPLTNPAQRFGDILQTAAEQQKFFFGAIRFGLLYDTNVPVVPGATSNIVAQAIREGLPRSDSGGELASVNLSYTWLKNPDWEGTVSYQYFQTYYNHLVEFNASDHTPTLGIQYATTVNEMPLFMGSLLAYDFMMLGNSRFLQRIIFNPYATLTEGQGNIFGVNFTNSTTLQFRLQPIEFFHQNDIISAENRNAVDYMFGPLHFFAFKDGYVKLGYQYDYEQAQGRDWTYAGYRGQGGAQYNLPWWDIRLRYDLDYQFRSYKFNNALLPETAPGTVKRRDSEFVHQFSVARDFYPEFLKSFPTCRSVAASCSIGAAIEYLFDDNRSNLAPYTYKRNVVTTSIAWRF